MALAQLPFLRGLGTYRPTFSLDLGRLSVFVIGYVVTNQIGYLTVQWLANRQQGGYSAYVAAFTFLLLPQGLFAVSIFTALLPGLSGHAVNERWDEFRERLSLGVRSTFFLILPAAIGYFVLSEPVVRLLQRGAMTDVSTDLVASVLRFFVLGLVPFSIFQLFLRAFYALQDTRTPFLVNLVATTVNIALNVTMFALIDVEGLAVGFAAAYAIGMTILGRSLAGRINGIDLRRIAASATRIALAGALMGALVWITSRVVERYVTGIGIFEQAIAVVIPVTIGVVAYLGFAYLLKVGELAQVRSLVGGRSRRSPEGV
jgi:putative peptidoglycan lipid II flippase